MSIGSVLSIARSALATHQTALQVAAQNVSNADTEGYTRQRMEAVAGPSVQIGNVNLGTGVMVQTIGRVRDAVLDATYREDAGMAAKHRAAADALDEIDATFGEPSDTGLAAAMDAFWDSWDDLAAEPASDAARAVVRARGEQLAGTFNELAGRLGDGANVARTRIEADAEEVNSLLRQVADINPRIGSAESGGHSANDLRDQRDRVLDRLAVLSGATSLSRDESNTAVFIAGRMMVDADGYHRLEIGGGAVPTFTVDGAGDEVRLGGSIGGRQSVLAGSMRTAMTRLDALAKTVVEQVNAVHSAGQVFTPVAQPAGNFFEQTTPAPVGGDTFRTARGIRLASTLVSSADVAAAAAAATGPGNNATASALALLRGNVAPFTSADGATTYATTTFDNFYRGMIGDVALVGRAAGDAATASETLSANGLTRRQSVSGVSTDEELVNIIKHQQAYAAAARVVSVVEEMTRTLIDLGR